MNKKGMSKKRQRHLTLVGITSVVTIWIAALALLFSQPGVQSNGKVLPTLASGLQAVAVLPDTGAVKPMSPTLLPTSLPVELPPGSQPDIALISAPSNADPEISPTLPALINIPDEPVPNSLVIRFKPEMSQAERLDYITSLGGQIVQEIKPLNTVIISLPANATASIQSQGVTDGVLENEPDYYAGALYAPNDSLAAGQWGLDVVKAPQAWDLLPPSTPSITVAVIDSGICVNHADLQGRIASNGWDFIDNDSAPQDEFGHGCAVSGIIAANSNNNLGIAGVAPNANVLPLRVLDAAGIGRYSNVAAAIVYAVDNGAGAINLSLGGPNPSAVLQDAVNYAEAHGITVIAAAGNSGIEQVFYPAAYPSVVAVGSVSQDLQRSPFSNYGAGIDLYAPGDGIMTTSLDGSFQNYSGTSVAAPYVTGVWALRQAMGKNLVLDGGIVSALYASDAPLPTEEPPSELCLLSDTQAAETAYFDLVQQNAATPGSVSTEQLESARAAYLGLAEQCANALYDDNMTIDGGGISPFAGEISPLFQIFGTKWQQASPTSPQIGAAFNQGQPPAEPGGIITFSFMPSNVSLANKEVENGGGANALITAIRDLPTNLSTTNPIPGNDPTQLEPICDLQGRIRQAFDAWESVANVDFVEIPESGLVPFGASGAIGDMRIGAQIIDGMKGELGHAYFPPPDPEIVTSTRSGDIFLDRSEVWGCEPSAEGVTPRVIDIGLVMLHELGHALGMQHERAAGVLALMNPTYNTGLLTDAAGGNLSLTTALRSDDQSGARAIYGGIGVSAPVQLTVLATDTDTTPTFTWLDTVTGGADYFEIEIYLDNNGQPGDVIFDSTTSGGNTTSNKSFTIPNTLQSLPYRWRVRAFDEGAYGEWSEYAGFSITVGIPAPLIPTPGQVLNSGDVRFQWAQVGSTNTYLLQVATQAEFTPESLLVNDPVSGTTFTTTLTDGTYYWRVQTGNNAFSIVNSFRVDAAALVVDLSPGAPNASPVDGADFTGAGANENITVQWNALDGVSEYQLQLDTSENFVGLLFLDKLFLDKLFLDKLFLDKLFLDKLFLDKLFLDKLQTSEELFLDKLFLDKLFLDKLFLDKLFLDKLFLDKLFLDKLFLDKLFLDKLFLDKLFLDKLFLDKIEYSGGPTASFTFDSLPLSEGVHYWRVRPRLPDGSFGPWSESRSFTVRTQDTKVVINEIKLSDPSWIEFHNTGTQTANMGGWQFFAYGPSGETQLLYTFPPGFTMQPGGYSVLYEGTGTDTDRALYTGGSQIDWPLTAQGEAVTGEALNGFGSVVPALTVPTAEAQVTGVESASLAAQVQASATPFIATTTASAQADDDIVTAQTPFNIAIGDTVSDGVPGAGAGNIESAGTTDTYTFAVTAGQIVYFDYLSTSNTSLDWALRSPTNVLIFSSGISADGGRRVLTETGNYVITVNDNSNVAIGTYSFMLWNVPPPQTFAINFGDTVSLGVPNAGAGSIEQPGAQDKYTFAATAGQIIYADALSSTNTGVRWELRDPANVQVFETFMGGDGGRRILTQTGTYTITVSDAGDDTGDYSFKLSSVTDSTFPIAIGDLIANGIPAAGAGNIETPGVQDSYTFTATANQIVVFDALNTSTGALRWELRNPSNGVIYDVSTSADGGQHTLVAGTYTIRVYSNNDATGSYSFRMSEPSSTEFATAIGNTVSNNIPATGAGNITPAGNIDVYIFGATAGQSVSFDVLSGAAANLQWRLQAPSSAELFNTSFADQNNISLPTTGVYTLTVQASAGNPTFTGTYSFNILEVPLSQEFAISIGDMVSNGVPEAGAGNIETQAGEDVYAFTATAGQVVYFEAISSSNGNLAWRLENPSSVTVFDLFLTSAGGRRVLTQAGTYTLTAYGFSNSSGTYSFKLWNAVDNNFAINIGDTVSPTVPGDGSGNIEMPGAQDNYTFTATAGQVVYFEAISSSNSNLAWQLISPSSTTLFDNFIDVDGGRRVLAQAGTYTVRAYSYLGSTGTYSFRLLNVEDDSFDIDIGDTVSEGVPEAGAGNIESQGAQDNYTFTASAGQIVYLDALSSSNSNLAWQLISPSSTTLFDNFIDVDGGRRVLAQAGTYTIRAYSYLGSTGTYNFSLLNVEDDTIAIDIGDTVSDGVPEAGAGSIESLGAEDNYTFSVSAGQTILFEGLGSSNNNIAWRLQNPSSVQIFDLFLNGTSTQRTLADAGTYTLNVYGYQASTGSYSFRTTNLSDTVQPGPTFTVNTTANDDDGACGTLDCSLIEAINAANAQAGANTIDFALTFPATITLTATLPTISTAITIDGPGVSQLTISGDDIVRVFHINSDGILAMDGLTVANGRATTLDGGGGLYNAGGTVTLANVLFDSNTTNVEDYGGAIFNQAGSLTVNNSTFTNNSADYGGGAIFNWKGSATITGSIFGGGNSAAVGAALHNYSPDGGVATMTVTGGEIADNNADAEPGQGGGAIMSEGTAGAAQLNVNGTNIHDNSGYQAGGIWVHSGTATLTNINLHDNSANTSGGGLYVSPNTTVTITGATISGNISSGEGGGLWSNGAVNVTNTTISDNTASTGGAAANYGTMTVNTSTFSGNETTVNQGGAIANFNTITVDQSTFNNNLSALNGGVLDNAAFGTATASATFTNSTLNNNTANGVGGALLNYADTPSATAILTVRNSTISGNISIVGFGGGIANFGGGGTETVNVEFSTFVSNEAVESANLRNMPDKTFNVKNSITALPVSGANCGGFMTSSGVNFMDDISCNGFTQVTSVALNLGALANNGGPTQTIALGAGSAAINTVIDCTTLSGATVTTDQRGTTRPQPLSGNCDAGAYEAAPLVGSLTVTTTQMIQDGLDGRCSLPEAIIAANTATQSGDLAGECAPNEGTNTITLGTNQIYTLMQVDNDSSGPNGLPDITSDITLVMNGSTIQRATDAIADFRIFSVNEGGSLTINGGGTIKGGKLSTGVLGSAVYNLGTTSINNAIIENNQSGSGAIANYGTLSITASILRNNQAVGYGGAIYNLGQLNLMNNIFEDNQAEIDGGAIFSSGSSTIARSSFVDNHAEGSAGAIINAGSMTLENATISGNSSDGVSAILNLGSSLTILHTTIADNSTDDNDFGAVQNNSGTLTVTNSIIANNGVGDNCIGTITDGGGNIQYPDESCVVYFDTANPLLGQLTLAGNAYFYPLLTGSPALDHGAEASCLATDIRGVARPAGDCDSGSYEGSVALTGDLTVTTTQPLSNPTDGLCSLVEAIDAANSGNASGSAPGECVPTSGADVITLGTGLTYTLTVVNNPHINGSDNGLPTIISPITINGNGSTITRSSEANFRFFYVDPDGSLTINNVTLSNGFSDPGGAILSDGSLTLNSSSIADNNGTSGGGLFLNGATIINNSSITGNNGLSPDGGGIFVNGNATLTMTNSTVAGNSASNAGGGIVTGVGSNVTVQIFNSTIANNTAAFGGGISVFGGSVTVYNTIIANNTGDNCSGTVSTLGNNLQWPGFSCSDDLSIPSNDPLLGPLTGSPAYLPLGTDSPAIDAADADICTASPVNGIDQRGIPRGVDGNGILNNPQVGDCDIGAVEITEAPALVPGTTGGAAALVSPLTTDFVRFGDTTLGPANINEWTGDNVAVTDSSDNNVTIGRDPSSGDTNHVTDWATQRPTEGGQNFTNVLINEIYTGSNDYVELYNPRAETADISNWELKLYDGNDQLIAAPGATYTVRFVAGTLLRPGQFLIVGEENPGSGIDFIPVATIDWDDANASGAVTLTNGLTPIDFVRFGSSQANQLLVEPPTGTPFTGVVQSPLPGESIGRNSISDDLNAAPDWYSQVRSAGLVNPAIAPPANDNFTGATTIDALPFRDTGDTTNASAVNDPLLDCGASVGHTIWYKYTPTTTQTIRLQTDGSDFDTVLAVFTLTSPNTPQQIAGLCSQRDDEINPQPGSRLSFQATVGTTYYILIGGQLNVSGQYIFSVNAPDNDDVHNASLIGSLPFRTFDPDTKVSNTNTTAATILDSEPVPTCAPSAGRTIWYRYEAANATKLRLRTAGTLFDTVITVYTGTPENLVEVACNNDDASETTSDLGFTPVPGTTYYFQVSGNSDQGGDLLFEVDVFPAPDNDLIDAAYTVTADGDGTFSVTTPDGTTPAPFDQDTTGATSTDDPIPAPAEQCGLNMGATVWFSYTAQTADTVVFQTFNSKYDTSLSIWSGELPDNLTQLFCNDDVGVNKNSRLTLGDVANGVVADVQIAVGTTYYIGVSGYFGETGDLVFNAFTPQITPPENDRVTTPYDIMFNAEDGTYSVIGQPAGEDTPFMQDTTGAFPELVIPELPPVGWESEAGIDVPTPTCSDDVGYTVWYKYAAPERQQIVFDAAGSDFDTVITAYVLQGDSLVEVGCNDDFEGRAQSKLTLNTDAGVTLYLLFGGFKRDRGNLDLVISQSISVTSFTLVDAADGSANIDPLLDGAVLVASELPDTISIRANTDPEEIGSVKFELSGAAVLTTTDNEAPYALNGNNEPPDNSYIPWAYAPGTYTLKATPYAGNNGLGRPGTPLTITFTISDNQPPVVSASADPTTITLPINSVNLSATATDDGLPLPPSLTYTWSRVSGPADVTFGTPTALNTSAAFTLAGTYTLRFTASDSQLSSSADVIVIVLPAVGNQPPVADAGDNQTVTATRPTLKKNVTLDGSGSTDSDGTIDSYLWTEGGIQIASGVTPTVDLAIGTHTITLTVVDNEFSQATDTVEIVVQPPANSAPVAEAGNDQFVTDTNKNGTEPITLDGSGSADPDGNDTILTYAWTENGAPLATGKTAQVTLSVGSHTITLTVTDDLGVQDTDDVLIEIVAPAVVAPTANAGPDQVVNDTDRSSSEPVTLNGSGSADDGSIISYIWSENGSQIATGVNPTIDLNVGTHTITLTVTDDDNATGTDTVVVKVNAPPTANAGLDQTVSAGTNNIALDGSLSSDTDGTIVAYSWSENGIEFSNMVAPPALTKPVGVYTFTLTVTDNNSATGTDSVVITVIAQNQAPVVTASANPTTITLPTNSVSLSATATDDGLPAPAALTYNWTAVSPPAPVTFGTPNALNTSATFTAAGSYTLRFTASDGQLTGTADVIVTVLPQNTGPITVDDQIELSSDDVNEDGSIYDARNRQLWFGSGQSVSKSFMGLRFNNLEIPRGAVITEAHIEVYTATAQWIRMRILIGAEAVDDSATFTSATRPSTRAFTSARLDYQSNTPWMGNTWNNIGDVKAVVQEIVNRPGWLPGNSLSILIKGLGTQWGRKFVTSYDGDPAHAPRLVVSYAGGPPPTNNPPDVTVNAPDVTVNEGLLATISGTVSDPDNNPVTLTASLGTIVKTGNTWSWSYTPADGPLNQIVTISAADNRGGSDSVTFNLIVNNVVPTASFSAAPLSTYPNTPVTLTFSSPVDVAADLIGLTYTLDCGNGSVQTSAAPTATCTYTSEGTFTALGRITDKDGGYSDYQAVITVTSTPTAPTTIAPQVNGSSDDVNENGATFQVNTPTVWVGTEGSANQSYTGLRFNNLGIPAGATITEAHLEFYVPSNQWIGVDVLIAADAADNSATFSSGSRPSGRPVTTNRVEHHSNVSWPANTWNTLTGNLSGVVQEIVSRPGWQSGNSLSLILKGMGSRFGRKFVASYDGSPAFAPRLVIQYTVPSVPPPVIEEPPPAPIILPTPPSAAFTSDVTAGVAPLTVTFSNLSSGDIAGYSWDFGDSTGSTDANPSHAYSGVGAFTVTLSVTGLDGTISTAQTIINVAAPPPAIEVIPPPPIEETTPPPTEEVSAETTEPPPEATATP